MRMRQNHQGYEDYILFFFQAEDGIRDLTVTGVQTCALPIFMPAPPRIAIITFKAARVCTFPLRATSHGKISKKSALAPSVARRGAPNATSSADRKSVV